MPADSADLLVAGGGPAGLALAIAARLRGMTVTVLDRRRPPIDSACGEGIMPEGVARLRALGVSLPPADSVPFDGIRFIEGDLAADGGFRHASGFGVRRTALHAALVERAADLGADLRWGVGVSGLREDGFDTDRGPVRGESLVGADGRLSRVRTWAGLDGPTPRRPRFGVRRHFAIRPWGSRVEVHWAEGVEAYLTAVAPDRVGVALLSRSEKPVFNTLLERLPRLVDRLAGSEAASRDRGGGPFGRTARRVVAGRLALIGDATGSLDPISGEGLSLAFHDGIALADALSSGRPGDYPRSWREARRWPRRMTALLVLLADHPSLRRRVLRSLSAQPDLLSRFLAPRGSTSPPRILGRYGLAHLVLVAVSGSGRLA